MSWLAWIGLGLIAGLLANWIWPGRSRGGCLATVVLGVVGALVGGYLAQTLTGSNPVSSPFDVTSVVVSVLGALLVLWVWSRLSGRRSA